MVALLVIIYITFISLGLPDSLLGCAWPSMYVAFGVPIASAGVVSMVIAGGTIVSSLLSERLIRRFGTAAITVVSVAMTAAALLGISLSGSFAMVILFAIPLGLGAGSVDAALNNFVALHYRAVHMNWLHCFWGIGASIGPIIISYFMASSGGWSAGYRAISLIQFALSAILVGSLPLWKKARPTGRRLDEGDAPSVSIAKLLRLPAAKSTLLSFFCYCSIETTVGLWGSIFLVVVRSVQADVAARWISLYYIGITVGRFVSGVLSTGLSSIQMLRLGQGLIGVGIVLLLLPFSGSVLMAGLFLIGLGCAPIYPTLLHETPRSFGKANSQAMMGLQMATAYLGSTLMPPLFGWLGAMLGYGLLPLYLGLFLALMVVMVQVVYKTIDWKRTA